MSWSHVESEINTKTTTVPGGTITVTLSSVSAGDLIVVSIASGSGNTFGTPTDTLGNAYTFLADRGISTGEVGSWYAVSGSAGSSVVISQTWSTSKDAVLTADRYQVAGTIAAGTPNEGAGTGTAASLTTSLTVTGTALVYGAYASCQTNGGTVTAGTGFTLRGSVPQSTVGFGLSVVDCLNDTTNPDNPSLAYASSTDWAGVGVVFTATAPASIVPYHLLFGGPNLGLMDTP